MEGVMWSSYLRTWILALWETLLCFKSCSLDNTAVFLHRLTPVTSCCSSRAQNRLSVQAVVIANHEHQLEGQGQYT
jgi:hypothetical protein